MRSTDLYLNLLSANQTRSTSFFVFSTRHRRRLLMLHDTNEKTRKKYQAVNNDGHKRHFALSVCPCVTVALALGTEQRGTSLFLTMQEKYECAGKVVKKGE